MENLTKTFENLQIRTKEDRELQEEIKAGFKALNIKESEEKNFKIYTLQALCKDGKVYFKTKEIKK